MDQMSDSSIKLEYDIRTAGGRTSFFYPKEPAKKKRIQQVKVWAPFFGTLIWSFFSILLDLSDPIKSLVTFTDVFVLSVTVGFLVLIVSYPLMLLIGIPFISISEKNNRRSFFYYLLGGVFFGMLLTAIFSLTILKNLLYTNFIIFGIPSILTAIVSWFILFGYIPKIQKQHSVAS